MIVVLKLKAGVWIVCILGDSRITENLKDVFTSFHGQV